jgi:hypothetical protein
MRSRLEARYAAAWDKGGLEWEYEPRAYASPAGQYLPDFVVGGRFVEIKPTLLFDEIRPVLSRMEIIHDSEPSAELVLFIDEERLIVTRSGVVGAWRVGAMSSGLWKQTRP